MLLVVSCQGPFQAELLQLVQLPHASKFSPASCCQPAVVQVVRDHLGRRSPHLLVQQPGAWLQAAEAMQNTNSLAQCKHETTCSFRTTSTSNLSATTSPRYADWHLRCPFQVELLQLVQLPHASREAAL
jgi:hypothetical protein